MNQVFRRVLLCLGLIFPLRPAGAFEAYDLIDSVVPSDQQPRLLNSDDLSLQPTDPQPLFSPTGDFDGDKIEDMAIAGIYNLPSGPKRYFLLVGTQFTDPIRFKKLFFSEYDRPVFLHQPATTGDKDPGDQAFSITFCSDCQEGFDFYWNAGDKKFDQRPWVRKFRTYQTLAARPTSLPAPDEIADAALKIVGALPDVQKFVAGVKKRKGELGTRVEQTDRQQGTAEANVCIFEKKKGGKDVLYDQIRVDTETGKILKREKRARLGDLKARDKRK